MANEKRLIDADALLAEIQRIRKVCKKVTTFTAHNVISCIKIAPTVDAVEVCKCMDCEHWEANEETRGDGYCKHGHWAIFDVCDPLTMATDFCSYGERKCHEI